MKCLNPKCPAPSFVESLGAESIKFCPICGCSVEASLKSPENNQNNEKSNQTEEKRSERTSLKQNKNGTTVTLEASHSSPSSEPNGRDEKPAGSGSADGGTGNQDQAEEQDGSTSSVALGDVSDGSGSADGGTENQDQAEEQDGITSSVALGDASDGSGSADGGTENQDQITPDHTRNKPDDQRREKEIANASKQSTSERNEVTEDENGLADGEKKRVVSETIIMVNAKKEDKKEVVRDVSGNEDGEANNVKTEDNNVNTKDKTHSGTTDHAQVPHDSETSHSPVTDDSKGSKNAGNTAYQHNNNAAIHVASTPASSASTNLNDKQNLDSPAGSTNTSSKGKGSNEKTKSGGNPSPSGNKNQGMNKNDMDKIKKTANEAGGSKIEARNGTTSALKSSGSDLNKNDQPQDGYFYQKPALDEQSSNKGKAKNADSYASKVTQQPSSHASSTESSGSDVSENVTIVFHALLAPHFMFAPGYENIFVCGGFPFKGWNDNQLEMAPIRWFHNGYVLIEGQTQIPFKFACHRITYKYRVLKVQEGGRKYVWEELVGFSNHYGNHTNRCFYIHERCRKPKGIWHQYDDGIFRPPGSWESFLNNFPMYKFVNPVEGRQLAMQVMLPDWDSFGDGAGEKKGSEVLDTINQVVYCIGNAKRETGGYVHDYKLKDFSLEQVMLSYIEPRLNLNYELAQATSDVQIQAKRLATSLAIAAIASNFVRKFSFNPEDEHLIRIFECLAINSSLGQQRLERILEILMNGYYSPEKAWRLLEGILELCQHTITYRPRIHHWLLAVPLMHFLSKSCQPYTEVAATTETPLSDDSYWGTNGLDLSNVQKSLISSPMEVFYRLKQMFELDPLLRRTFLFALPLRDLGGCVRRGDFPPDEMCWTLCARLQTKSYISEEEVSSINECLSAITETIDRETEVENETEKPTTRFNIDRYISLEKASQEVLDFFLKSLKDMLALACAVLTMLSKTLSLLKYIVTKPQTDEQDQTNHDICSKSIAATTKKVRNCLEKVFKGNLGISSDTTLEVELKTWSAFYHVEFSDNTFRQSWEDELKESLNLRIKKMNYMQRINFYSRVKFNHFHQKVEECFQEAAFDAIKSIIEVGIEADHTKAFESLRQHDPNSSQSKQVGEMMSLLLKRCWPKDTDQPDRLLTHVLTWNPMANYLRYFTERSQTLSGESQLLLTRTTSCLEDVHHMVSDASVTVNVLRILRGKEDKYCELLEIMRYSIGDSDEDSDEDSEKESEEDDEQDDTNKDFGRIYKKARTTLQTRLDELAAFEQEREQLRSFLGISSILEHVDVDDMKERVNADVSKDDISDLAVHTCGKRLGEAQVQVTFFGLSKELKTMITTMHTIHNSRIFNNIWREKIVDSQHDEQLTLEEVVKQVWTPTFKKCKDILQAVLTGNITLGDVDKRFEGFKDRYAELEQELVIMDACSATVDAGLIKKQVNQIRQYHRLTNYIAAAEKILEFAEKMNLRGDFDMVDTFRLQISPESKRQPLKSLQEEFIQTGGILGEFTPERLQCLDAVMESKDFIVWLKKAVPDSSEIKVLVDLAMMSTGEGDMESDRIAALHTCTRGFKPLIYDLEEDDGFERLVKLCRDVWDDLEHNPRLPLQMNDTSRRLEWLKNVLEFHGSVTMSSLQQVETIMKHGTLTIGWHGKGEEININTVISLRVPPEKVKGMQKETYSLEDLKDLQSKLMLIAGKSAGQEHVEKFTEMLQGAICLGTVYTTLCETGEVSHLDWKKEFTCRRKDVIPDLQTKYDEFEEFLKAWTEILNCQRKKCKELNYFTAKQLLYMRKEIADLRRGREFASLHVQLYTLLDSVLPGVTARLLQEALIAIDIDVDFPEEVHPLSETEEEEKIPDSDLRKRYEKFFNNVKELGFPEEVALAAIVVCDCPREESDLLMWCLQNNGKEDEIQDLCDEGAQIPKYASLFPQESVPDVTLDDEEKKSDIDRLTTEDGSRNFAAELDQTLGGLYLSLEELSTLLDCLAKDSTQEDQNKFAFPGYLTVGKPNLLLVPQRDILATVLGLYMESKGLPSSHEVLICTQDTTLEEVKLLWRRVLTNTSDKFYCLVNADLLSYNVSQQAVQSFYDLAKREYPASEDYKVVVICSNEQEVKSHIVSALDEYRVAGAPRCPRPSEVTDYLQEQFVAPRPQPVVYQGHRIDWIPAAHVESRDRLSVRVISSDRAGTGKSLIVEDYSKRLDSITNNSNVTKLLEEHVTPYVIVPLHGKTANLSDTVGVLLPYSLKTDVPMSRIFHIDVSPSVEHGLDTLLFNLLLLGSIQDNKGRVWKRNPRDLYIVEVTSSHDTQDTRATDKYARLYDFYHELPRVTCVTPMKALDEMKKDTASDSSMTSFNEGQFQSEPIQRVYQYLRLYDTAPEILHEFQFEPEELAEGGANCLSLLMRYCGVTDPSWAELRHFVDFLNYQLTDFEQSVFCQMENVADTLEGFRMFVVRFMTFMAQDFSTRSLSDIVVDDDAPNDEPPDIAQFQLRRRWESSPHPYMFFNPDHQTFTFLGFRLDPDGNLINPSTGEMIEQQLMTRHLRTGLNVQRVNFDEDFEQLNKGDKIQKICAVLGVEWPRDPDDSYELTEDNAKKMLAIHMRFRCGIPVVVMGETGCGKTKLIRYLCGLQKGFDERKNMLLVKVHGGTTFQDIEKKVQQARQMAKENSKNNVETILFFDEVNTTEALDLVKEIMVDRRLNGRPLDSQDDGLRFIAACNPYRKHTDTMIKKLESAGLGYSVKTGNTTERIGCVPLRHLVYRVHALPDSMRSLIWDFGQLKPEVERLYTRQIVLRHVITEERIPGDESLVDAITAVLAASQQYMREQSDECSFVSLRDVERTMNVMVWFYEHRQVFKKFAKQEDKERTGGTDNDSEDNPDDDNDDDHEDESDSDSDGHVKEMKNEDEEETATRENEKPRPGLMFSGLNKSIFRQPQEPADLEPISSGSGSIFPPHFPDVGNEYIPVRPFASEDIPDIPYFIEEEEEDLDDPTKDLDPVTWSLILAIGVCYHAKLQDRSQYRQDIAKTFKRPCLLYGGADRILQEITSCQKAVLEELDPGPNIARNTALSENVFMMVICMELRIPLFVIGKPGSSKSLAKTVVADNMQGDASKSKLFKSFKEVQMSSHQCSPLSTPEGIQETFRQCANFQKDKNPEKFVSVVVLDEVGLAEDSPLMPLKTLHPLLEDGVTSSDDIIETDEKPTRVAFIGLSNWALDPAKMNRGIMLSRDVPGERELEDSAMGICASDKEVQELMKPIIPELAAAYSDLYQQQKEIEVLTEANKDEFFGLRDFYSLIKMLRVIAEKKRLVPDWRDVEYAVRRNFGGLDVDELKPVDIFMEHLGIDDHVRREEQDQKAIDVSPLKLIKSSLEKDSSEKDSRYLLILTENHAALGIVEHHLKQMQDDKQDDKQDEQQDEQQDDTQDDKQDDLDPVLIFGSSFPKDLEYTQVCRNINDIKVCMETGRTVILLNMESLYEGLYDALNQYYVEFAGNRYVDLGLGSHRVKCRVHKDFRLIVIAEKDTVYKKFPIPLINRLEKHFLVLSTSLTKPQEKLVATLKSWVQLFSSIDIPGYIGNKKKFTEDDAFVGYHDDTIPSVVLQVCSQLGQDGTTVVDDLKDQWEEEVLMQCKRRLVQCCPPDAIVRLHYSKLQHEADELWDIYKQQQHSSLASFVSSVDKRHQDGLLIQVSTHSKLLSEQNLKEIGQSLNLYHQAISCITLQQFQTEQQFCDSVGNFFAKQGGRECLLIVQCNAEDLSFNLLACARHHLLKQRSKITEVIHEDVEPTHIIVIIQLPKMFGRYPNFVGFQGQRWESVHIDELFTPSFYVPSLENVKDHSLSELFAASIDMCFSRTDEEEQVLDAVDVIKQSVQAAAGRIEDGPHTASRATKRIVILLSLLTKDRSEELDENSFSHVLLRRVHHLLKEKDASAPEQGANWSTSESLESSELQESGTYRKALWRRIQNAVVPVLSEVIAYMDRDGNLELLQTDVPWIKDLWLKIFADDKLAQLHYDSVLTNDEDGRQIKKHVPVTSSGRDSHGFQCQLPFSWLLKENIDNIWLQAKSVSGNSDEHLSIQECFQGFVAQSDICDEINVIEKNQDAMERYIHDFVHMNCKPVEQGEDELIARALVVEARHQHALSASHDDDFEFPNISLVHKAYSYIEHRIACFSQLVQCFPGIVPKLLDIFTPDENEMILDAMALQMCLESLEPLEKSFNNSGEAKKWCDDVVAVRATAERILNTIDRNQLEDEEKRMSIIDCCRPLWARLTAVRLFIEHVYPSKKKVRKTDPENIIKLCKVLDGKTDFSRASSIEAVELFLFECIENYKKSSVQTVNEFRHHCNSFFMELISLLCFGADVHRKTLDPEVFEIFMRYITGRSSSATKSFSPFPDFEVDKTPVVRSFLLQQLLTISLDEVKKYLQRYLSDAQALSQDRHHVTRVCQLVVDCIEDSTSSTLSQRELPISILIRLAASIIGKGIDTLHKVRYSDTLSIEALEAVARMRHVLGLTAEFLFKSHVASDEKFQEPEVKSELDKLLNVVQGMCEQLSDRAPLVYLLKQLTRRYGASVIKDLTQDPEMFWLIPREFEERQIDTSDADRFVVYNEEYTSVRDALANGLLSGSVDELSTLTQIDGSDMSSTTKMDVMCLLSIYREITCGYREPRQQLQEYEELREFFDEHLSPEARPLAVQLLNNSHGMGFTALSVQPAQPRDTINLAELVVHTMVVLQCSNDSDITNTLRALLMNPGYMKNSFLPTMPEDDFESVRRGLIEQVKWYECPEGHRYSIGDCGNANQESVCPECKSGIGGTGYKLLPGNAPLPDQNADRSNRGHILGNANMDQASSVVQPGRNLSPAVVHTIRLIMHSAMLVGACRHPQESSQIFSPPVEPERLKQFLWAHLTHDLRGLSAALNRSEDEALLTVHFVLAQITRSTTHDYSPGTGVLDSARARRQWEEEFSSRFIEPVISTCDERIQACLDAMTNDSRVGTDPLMREVYELDNSGTEQEEEEEEPQRLSPMKRCFWRYRPSITVENAKQRFSEKMKSDKKIQKCKILQHFFKEEYRLRVVRYLPNINKLHKLLTDRFYQRINQKQASEMTVKDFETKLKDLEKKEFKTLFGSFKDAWMMVRERLDKQGRYKLSSTECSKTIDENSPMSILIPSTHGLGRCSLSLVFYLVTAHNEFMETYFNITVGKARQDNKIGLPEVTNSQLVSYESDRDLLPLIQAHRHYSLEVGHGTLVEYDWTAIQRQLIDRFIRGRPLVEFKEPKFVFLRNNDADVFAAVRSKIEQESISSISARTIMSDLRHLNEVCDVKLSLEIAMGFLASSGGRPEQLISEYLHDVLHMPSEKGLRSRRAEQYCHLKHIVHLWQLVTTQRAKILLQDDQDPFDEVQEGFKEEIPRKVLLILNRFLRNIDCSRFCGELLEMITFSLNQENEKHLDISFREFFEWHMDGRDEATDVSGLPDELLLKHSVKTWENVLEKSQERR